jgi:hypothetical protein
MHGIQLCAGAEANLFWRCVLSVADIAKDVETGDMSAEEMIQV